MVTRALCDLLAFYSLQDQYFVKKKADRLAQLVEPAQYHFHQNKLVLIMYTKKKTELMWVNRSFAGLVAIIFDMLSLCPRPEHGDLPCHNLYGSV